MSEPRKNHHGTPLHCTEVPAQVTKRFCSTVWETACTTETKTFTVITGYENDDCRERCWRKKRSPFGACLKKTSCTKKPIKEKRRKNYNVCKNVPEEVRHYKHRIMNIILIMNFEDL